MKPFRTIFLFSLILISCSSHKNNHTIKVKFEVDGKEQDISNNFKMFFSQKGKTLEAKVTGIYIVLPGLLNDTNVTVSFVYDHNKLNFKDVSVSELFADQDMAWDFEILNKGFNRISTRIDSARVKKLYVWGFDPQEHGDGIELMNPIYK